jgi:hypothetical protein
MAAGAHLNALPEGTIAPGRLLTGALLVAPIAPPVPPRRLSESLIAGEVARFVATYSRRRPGRMTDAFFGSISVGVSSDKIVALWHVEVDSALLIACARDAARLAALILTETRAGVQEDKR